MRRITAISLTAVMLFAFTSCSKEPEQTAAPTTAATTAAPVVTEVSETTAGDIYYETPDWEGYWQFVDTEEHFEISQVTDTGLKVVYYHFEEGLLEQFTYDMEFDDPAKTIASEIGPASSHGGWEYAFNFKGDSIIVQSKFPDQTFNRSEKPADNATDDPTGDTAAGQVSDTDQ